MKSVNFIVSVTILLTFKVGLSAAACGTALPKGTLICNVEQNKDINKQLNVVLVDGTRCTHAAISVDFKCANETCNLLSSPEFELIRTSLPSNVRQGIYLRYEGRLAKFLKNEKRRRNTAEAFIKFMEEKNQTFAFSNEYTWEDGFNKYEKNRTYFDFLKIFAVLVHEKKWHLGVSLQVGWTHLQATYDLVDLAKHVDWFNVAAHHNKIGSEFWYFHLFTPLSSKTNDGTVKYWIEHVLQWMKPECLLLEVSGRADGFEVESRGLEPGPGSRVITPIFGATAYRQVCIRNLGVNCREFWDEEKSVPWSACGSKCYTYDNPRSAKLKAEMAKSYNLTGVVFWNFSDDDEEGVCGQGPFPMVEALYEGIKIN